MAIVKDKTTTLEVSYVALGSIPMMPTYLRAVEVVANICWDDGFETLPKRYQFKIPAKHREAVLEALKKEGLPIHFAQGREVV